MLALTQSGHLISVVWIQICNNQVIISLSFPQGNTRVKICYHFICFFQFFLFLCNTIMMIKMMLRIILLVILAATFYWAHTVRQDLLRWCFILFNLTLCKSVWVRTISWPIYICGNSGFQRLSDFAEYTDNKCWARFLLVNPKMSHMLLIIRQYCLPI